jgi:hypothetical protein
MKSLSLLLSVLIPLSATLAAPAQHATYEPDGAPIGNPVQATAKGVRLLPASMRQRFNRDTFSGLNQTATSIVMRGWRGETVQTQVLVEAPEGFTNLSAKSHAGLITVRPIRYTTGAGYLVPDVIDTFDGQTFKGVVRPLLLTYTIPAEGPTTQRDVLEVSVNGQILKMPVILLAANATLPPPAEWAFHLDLWQHPDAAARWHDVPMWSAEHLAMLRPQMRYLADMGQKTITCTLVDEAWQGQTYDHFRSMIEVTKTADGKWAYDYNAFDTWVSFARETIGMQNATINCYTMIPWSLTFAYTDAATGTIVRPKLVPGTPEYEAFWGPFLTAFVAHLKEKGWLEITRIAMDERPDHLLKPALEIVQKYAPMLKIVAACDHPSAINRDFQDVSYAYDHCEKLVAELPERKAQGKTTTFYTCLHPLRPNTLMYSDLAEAEWMVAMAAHYGLDGMLRWAFHSWEENPFKSMDHVRFPTGDTAMMYPGDRPSLRLAAIRNGIETYEKIRILRAEAERQQRPEALATLTEALARFTVPRGKEQGIHEADLRALDHALYVTTEALFPQSNK